MKQPGFQASEPQPLETSRTRRARGYHRLGRLLLVALLLLLALIGCLASLAGVGTMMPTGLREWHWLALAGLGVFAASRVAVFALAAALNCPLCHGTVMNEKRCRKHDNAFRLWPLTYRASAVISLLFTGTFRRMYCGTQWRLKRTSLEAMQ